MIPLSSNSQNLKVVLAVVVLFLGWLIASMIPRTETPWDKTSSSFLARRPVTDADGELIDENPEYQRLWSQDKKNWDPEKKNVTIDYDSDFFGGKDESKDAADDGETADSSELSNDEIVRRWSDDSKAEDEEVPEIKVGQRPKWDDDSVLDTPVADPEELAPPMSPLGSDWEDESSSKSDTAESVPETKEIGNADAVADGKADEKADAPAAEAEPLFAQAESPAADEKSASPAETDPAAPVPLEANSEETAPAIDLPSPLPDTPEPETQTSIAASSSDRYLPFPTQRPPEQNSDSISLNPTTKSPAPLPMPTLTPSSGTQAAAAEPTPPTAGEGLISQVSGTFPGNAPAQNSRSAYYQEPTPAPAPAETPSAVSGPTAVSIYTAGPGENWDDIAAKSGLSEAEAARYFEVNSFRINSDRTVTEGMKLFLPKR
ncbi:MAG: hypothetical protein J6S40_09035 [Thermoguttaceae bacterium]|nr:hypothetical protein [Thermoguttaceae bacterium]